MPILGRNSPPKRGFDLIACQIRGRFTTTQPDHPHIALGDIPGTIQIGVEGMTTHIACEEALMSGGLSIMAPITLLTGISRINIDHPDPVLACFIFQKRLQFSKCPFMVPWVIFGCLSNPGQVLHGQDIPCGKGINDLFGDVVVHPSHKPFPSVPSSLEFTSGSRCAFRLEFCHECLPVNSLVFDTSVEGRVTGDCQRIDSEIDPQDLTVGVTRLDGDLFGEREAEEKPAFVVLDQGALSNLPIKVLFKTFGNCNGELDPSRQGSEGENCPGLSNCCTPREVVSDRQSGGNLWFRFGSFDHLHGLFDGITRKLGVEMEPLSEFGIAKFVEFGSVLDIVLPCYVNTKLDGLGKDSHCLTEDVRTISEFHFRCNNGLHTFKLEPKLKNPSSIPPPPCRGCSLRW